MNTKFAKSLEADYPILSDPGKKVARAYGVVTDKRQVPFRWTFYIGKNGKILKVDRMVKAADVEVSRVLTVHNRVVCTLIEGSVGSVGEALEVGRQSLATYDHFLCSTVIPQPAPEVLHLFSARN